MQVLEAILTRRSIRKFQEKPISEELVETLLRAGMAGPSAKNEQPWHFVVIKDKEKLSELSMIHPGTPPLAEAPLAILICADLNLPELPGFWSLDCAIAAQNILLTAHGHGLGSVWTGIYPNEKWVEAFRRDMSLPLYVVPFAIISIGYPAETKEPENRYNPDRIHFEKWL